MWAAPRAYWAFAVIALLYALCVPLPMLLLPSYALSACCLALLVADACVLPRAAALSVRRAPAEPFAMRRKGALTYAVQNRGRVSVRADIVEGSIELLQYAQDVVAAFVPARHEAAVERGVLPVARGTAQLDLLYVAYTSPIGFVQRRLRITQPQEIRVYPDLSAVERYGTLRMRNRLIEAGLRRMRLRGVGTEFESVREWEPGDAFRSIDWKATARTGKMMVAQYEVERSQNVMILLDAGRLMMAPVDEQRKFDFAVTAALSVASVAALANDKVGFVAFARDIVRARAPRAAGKSLQNLVAQMHDIEPRFEEADYERAFAYARSHVRKRSLIVFFTDMIDPAAQSAVLSQLVTLARHHVVVCAFMNDAVVDATLERFPQTAADAYRQGVALELADERRTAAAVLQRMGVRVIDVPAAQLTTALIDRYLEIKQRGAL